MPKENYNFCIFFRRVTFAFVLFCSGACFVCLPAEAQSSKEVRVAIDRLRAAVIDASDKLRVSEKSSTKNLKTSVIESLDQLHVELTHVITALDTIKDQQDKRIDNNQLYCILFSGNVMNDPAIQTCYLTNNPNNRFSKSLNSIQAEGWHLTSMAQVSDPYYVLAVYSKYIQ